MPFTDQAAKESYAKVLAVQGLRELNTQVNATSLAERANRNVLYAKLDAFIVTVQDIAVVYGDPDPMA